MNIHFFLVLPADSSRAAFHLTYKRHLHRKDAKNAKKTNLLT